MHLTDAQLAKIAKALGDEHRLQILVTLGQRPSMVCNEIQALCELAQPTISHHVKILADSDLIITEKSGRHLHLSLNREVLQTFTAQIQSWL
jgi:ArsR family transcriptional regulator